MIVIVDNAGGDADDNGEEEEEGEDGDDANDYGDDANEYMRRSETMSVGERIEASMRIRDVRRRRAPM